jgi:F-type H+-transporting ATPase subunit delta
MNELPVEEDDQKRSPLGMMNPIVLSSLLDKIKGVEAPDWTDNLDSGRLVIMHPYLIGEMIDKIQEKEINNPDYSVGSITTIDRDTLKEILDRIQGVDSSRLNKEQTGWSRRLQARPLAQRFMDEAIKLKQVEVFENDLKKALEICSSGDNTAYLEDDEVRFQDKAQFLKEEAGDLNPVVMSFVYDLSVNKQLSLLKEIIDEFSRLAMVRNFITRAEIITAARLDDEDISKIEKRLSALVGKKIFLEQRVDPLIVGGFIIKLGSTRLDASVRSRLDSMRKEIASEGFSST